MTTLPLSLPHGNSFKKALSFSIIAHIVIILLFVVKTAFLNSEDIDFSQAVRVDMVDLPDKAPPQEAAPAPSEPKPAPTLPPKEAEKPKPEIPVLPKDTKKEDLKKAALNKLKSESAIDKIKEDLAKESKTPPKPQTFKGQVLSPGTALSGLSKLQHDNYLAQIDTHVKQYWSLPQWMARANLKARVKIKIDDKGNVVSREIVKSSGNEAYDELILETVKKASPFPAPPSKFVDVVAVDGVVLGFPE